MSELLYRPDMDGVRQRMKVWWEGGDLGRPALLLSVPRHDLLGTVPQLPTPPGWTTHYSTKDFAYRLNLAERACLDRYYLGEAVPKVSPDLGPGCLALYLGCHGVEGEDTVWFEPCISDPERFQFERGPDNFYWDYTLRLAREQLRIGRGKFLLQFPDLIEGLDILAAMRGTEQMLFDLVERPEWVHASLRRITDHYFLCYDVLYELLRDEAGGSVYWIWGPGRTAKLQCDISAMLGPEIFREFMTPVLREMCQRIAYPLYHLDGPSAIVHLEQLLSIPQLRVVQWTPGAAAEPAWHARWWPLYHKTLDAGKNVYIGAGGCTLEDLGALRREFGRGLHHFVIGLAAESHAQADAMVAAVSG